MYSFGCRPCLLIFDEIGDLVRTENIKKEGGQRVLDLLVSRFWFWTAGDPPKKAHCIGATSMGTLAFALHGTLNYVLFVEFSFCSC